MSLLERMGIFPSEAGASSDTSCSSDDNGPEESLWEQRIIDWSEYASDYPIDHEVVSSDQLARFGASVEGFFSGIPTYQVKVPLEGEANTSGDYVTLDHLYAPGKALDHYVDGEGARGIEWVSTEQGKEFWVSGSEDEIQISLITSSADDTDARIKVWYNSNGGSSQIKVYFYLKDGIWQLEGADKAGKYLSGSEMTRPVPGHPELRKYLRWSTEPATDDEIRTVFSRAQAFLATAEAHKEAIYNAEPLMAEPLPTVDYDHSDEFGRELEEDY